MVQGARQVGKSTFAQMVTAGTPSRTVTLDSEETRAAAEADAPGFVQQHPQGTLVIDEIQRMPSLTLAIKATVDEDRRPGRFLLTGSSNLLHHRGIQDSLAGRAASIDLFGLSIGELHGRKDDLVGTLVGSLKDSAPASFSTNWERRRTVDSICAGSYPGLIQLSGRLHSTWVDSYLQRVIERDATDLRTVYQPARLKSLLRLIAANQSGELVKARLAEQAGLPATSITAYLDLLGSLYLVHTVEPWTPNLTKREVGRPKSLVTDSGVAARLNGASAARLQDVSSADHLGGLLEGFVTAELLKQQTWTSEPFRLFHFRDRTGAEVDLVIELDDGSVIGIEVKSSTSFNAKQFTGLKFLRDNLGDRFLGGVVLNTGQRGYRFAEKLWGLPVAALWEPLSG
nr:ATP-binding protein [Arthrobacter pigmenti]